MDAVDLDVENLFNNGQLDQIITDEHALPTATLAVPGLTEHFLNSQYCGGFNRVSWSRQGHVAVVSQDRSTVNVHCLRASTRTKEWKFSVARPVEAELENIVSVTWSPAGYDLAVIDGRGRIAIFSMSTTCLNRLNETRSASSDSPDEMGMPVGAWWLNQDRQDRPRNIISSSTRGDDKWTHNMTKAKALGPLYPRGFCMVNRQGVFSLTYQRPGARYTRTSVNLPSLPGTLYSHAAFSPTTENKILLAVHTTDGALGVYHVEITWPVDLMTDPASPSQPELTIEVIEGSVSMWSDFDIADNTLSQGYKLNEWSLTHLAIVPSTDIETAVREPPCIWAVFAASNPAMNSTETGFLMNSTVKRWSVIPTVQSLHPRFDDIPTKTETATSAEDVFTTERLADILFPQIINAIEVIEGGQMVAITTADGKTELWNPSTQAPVSYEGQTNEITSLAQFGFSFSPATNAITLTTSPNTCSALALPDDSKISLKEMEYHIQSTSQELDLTDSHQSASVAAAILAFARSCWSNTNGDDVLSCVQSNYAPQQYTTILAETYRTLFRDTEFIHEKAPGSEVERLPSKPIVIKVLSFQMGLLNNASITPNANDEDLRYATLASAWAWLAINLRYIATTYYIFYREYQASIQPAQNPLTPHPQPLSPSFVDAICHTIHWTLDFFRFMLTTVLEIGDRQSNPDFFTPPTFANNLGDAAGDGSQGLVALILNCQWSRTFLITISRAMRVFIDSHERGHNPLIASVVHTIRRYSVGKGMNITAIDKLLDPKWYARAGLRPGESLDAATIAKRQIAMCSSGRVGPEYTSTLQTILTKVINDPETGLRATGEIERLKLWTDPPDLNWLLLGYSAQSWTKPHLSSTTAYAPGHPNGTSSSVSAKTKKLYDVHRKSVIVNLGTPDQMVRRCVRCGSLSGDVDGADKSWSKNMVGYLARCVCDAYWILEPVVGEDGGK